MANEFGKSGGCQCGEIRYTVHETPLALNVCHCRDCQKQSGSAFGMSLVIKPSSFELDQGTLKTFELESASGRTKTCAFCPECGVRIYNRTSALCSVKAGTLDDTNWLKPDASYWTASRQSWVTLPDKTPCYEHQD